jgi:hypothetical protein
MNTIVLSLDEAALDLPGVIHRLNKFGGRAMLVGATGPMAEITPIVQPDSTETDRRPPAGSRVSDQKRPERTGPRVVYSKLTGLPVVTARPGERMVTSEEIYEELRGSFP